MRREVPSWVAAVVIVVVILIVVGVYVALGRKGQYQPTTPPPGWKPQPTMPMKMKGAPPAGAPQPSQPAPSAAGKGQ
jgi:hypothetical protein